MPRIIPVSRGRAKIQMLITLFWLCFYPPLRLQGFYFIKSSWFKVYKIIGYPGKIGYPIWDLTRRGFAQSYLIKEKSVY